MQVEIKKRHEEEQNDILKYTVKLLFSFSFHLETIHTIQKEEVRYSEAQGIFLSIFLC